MKLRRRIWFTALAALAAGCTTGGRNPDLGGLYDRAARHHDEHSNPVIVIPGILGSKLLDLESRQVVWGAFSGNFADPGTPEGARLVALPMRRDTALDELRDAVLPDGALDRLKVNLFGLPLELDAYIDILGTLGVGGYRDELLGSAGAIDYGEDHFTCFQFDYDWRRDIVENAKRLHEFIRSKRTYVQTEIERRYHVADADVKFDLVAHSMGGLITRYYLRYGPQELPDDGSAPAITWAGSRLVERAILIGPPNAGSASALQQLVEGIRFAPFLPKYEPAVLGTMPAIYQLLPRTRHGRVVDAADHGRPLGDIFDRSLWERMGWGLAAPSQDRVLQDLLPDVADPEQRRRIALDHLGKCLKRARRIARALDTPAVLPEGLGLYLFLGDAAPTPSVLAVDTGSGTLRVIEHEPGDGTVSRSSALMDERVGGRWSASLDSPVDWTQVTFLFTNHLGLTSDPAFTDNVLYLLLEDPR